MPDTVSHSPEPAAVPRKRFFLLALLAGGLVTSVLTPVDVRAVPPKTVVLLTWALDGPFDLSVYLMLLAPATVSVLAALGCATVLIADDRTRRPRLLRWTSLLAIALTAAYLILYAVRIVQFQGAAGSEMAQHGRPLILEGTYAVIGGEVILWPRWLGLALGALGGAALFVSPATQARAAALAIAAGGLNLGATLEEYLCIRDANENRLLFSALAAALIALGSWTFLAYRRDPRPGDRR